MVVFTCNNCGESLQKPKVEKHYLTVCQTFKNLTCVDCLKDFKEEEYAAHIKCMTEMERYSAKGSVVNVVRKGEVKQQRWTDMIDEFVKETTNATAGQKLVFNIMSANLINVPRKKMKFMNFIKNDGGNKVSYSDIESVFEMLEKYKAAQNGQSEEKETKGEESKQEKKKKRKAKSSVSEFENIDAAENDTVVNSENGTGPVKKKKSKKADKENTENETDVKKRKSDILENIQQELAVENNELAPQKKKKKKSKEVGQNDQVEGGKMNTKISENDQANAVAVSLQKKKKKQNVSESSQNGKDSFMEKDAKDDSNKQVPPQKKKKKNKNVKIENSTTAQSNGDFQDQKEVIKLLEDSREDLNLDDTIVTQQNGDSQKKKTKKGKANELTKGSALNDSKTEDVNNEDTFSGVESLSDKILKCLKNKETMLLSKLQKTVLKQYCKEAGVEETPKLIKKFNKQLKKMVDIEVTDDNVRLIK